MELGMVEPSGCGPTRAMARLGAARTVRRTADGAPDTHTQLEELLNEVWRQESFERTHPFTCGVIREAYRVRRS